eukprot:symbB.v1.2.012844.t3/scaffold887.1/size155094/11
MALAVLNYSNLALLGSLLGCCFSRCAAIAACREGPVARGGRLCGASIDEAYAFLGAAGGGPLPSSAAKGGPC